jgi:prepilin-type N-terminal cleavage/methylation domain-containing protein/prepilin-type processing-associated H-X9-DG protein
MKNSKAFTLMELLVVISIIALLLAILVPSLSKARELARRVVCANHIKDLATASNVYAGSNNGYFVPAGHVGGDQPAKKWSEYDYDLGDRMWFQNEAFRKYLDIESYLASTNLKTMPKKFLCPSDKISMKKGDSADRISYGYNNTDWRPWTIDYRIVGYKVSTVKNPAGTLNFVDAIDFWVDINGAHYAWVWDRIRDLPDPDQWPEPDKTRAGPVFYRHSEGANVGFYDGHAQWLKKQDIFDREGYNASPAWMGMWTATGRIIPGWDKKWPD